MDSRAEDAYIARVHLGSLAIWALALLPPPGDELLRSCREVNDAGRKLVTQGRYAEAQVLFRQGAEAVGGLPAAHGFRNIALQNLAMNCMRLGEYKEAEQLLRTVIREVERRRGTKDPTLVQPLANLALLWTEAGRPAMARKLIQRALECMGSYLAADRERVIKRLRFQAANNLVQERKYDEAESELRWLIANWVSPDQISQDERLALVNNLGAVLLEKDRFSESAELLNGALELYAAVFPSDHPALIDPLGNLATAYTNLNRHSEAADLQRRAIRISELSGDRRSLRYGWLLRTYAATLRRLNRKEEAKSFDRLGKAVLAEAASGMPGRHAVDVSELQTMADRR